jgi:hypothetical protein
MCYRQSARFVMDPRQHYRPLDRNARARVLHLAERIERATKAKGRRCGCLGLSGLAVLRALIHHCLGTDGRCDPSYARLQQITGLARATIAKALHALERLGLLRIVRRLIRRRIARLSPITGEPEVIVGTVQAPNLYAIVLPPGNLVPLPPKRSSVRSRKKPQAGFQWQQVALARPIPDWRASARMMLKGSQYQKPSAS